MKVTIKNILFFATCIISLFFFILLFLFIKNNTTSTPIKKVQTDEKITVVLDAGHGGEDGGAIGVSGVYEKDLNLSITLKIGEYLKEHNINTVYTRTEDILLYDRNADFKNRKKALDLAARVKIASQTQNCIFVSIHMNSFSESKYNGLQVYYSKNNPKSYPLANEIQKEIKNKLQPLNNRKVSQATSRIYLLDRIMCPAVLIECGFLSNPEECKLLETEIYQNQLAKIISHIIANYVEENSQTVLTN